jgi:hypothetical protein
MLLAGCESRTLPDGGPGKVPQKLSDLIDAWDTLMGWSKDFYEYTLYASLSRYLATAQYDARTQLIQYGHWRTPPPSLDSIAGRRLVEELLLRVLSDLERNRHLRVRSYPYSTDMSQMSPLEMGLDCLDHH